MRKYFCCKESRSEAVKNAGLNGIDFLEVIDGQKTLSVHFLNPLKSDELIKENIRIEGGERIRNIDVVEVYINTGNHANILTVNVDKHGDFSTYTLRLVKKDNQDNQPPDGFDLILSAIDFSFKVDCPSNFDCLRKSICPPWPLPQPEINYLAKDFASFRQLILDRMTLLMPQWKERNSADIGMVLIELLAYVGDYLSYQQDAISTETYLSTARKRISVRRHARLVDYFMHEGCNARALVQVQIKYDVILPKGTQLFTRIDGQPVCIPFDSPQYKKALAQNPEVFETMHNAMLFQAHNELRFYTWGSRECCLPKGATRATLRGHFPDLKAGDLLIFIEVSDPQTGISEDANPAHRHAVRLSHVISQDMHGNKLQDKLGDHPADITEIRWAPEDALPFPLCISSTADKKNDEEYKEDVSIALGNIVLADHGLTINDESLIINDTDSGEIPESKLFFGSSKAGNRCQKQKSNQAPPRFSAYFKKQPLTFAAPYGKVPLFGFNFDPQYETNLDNKELPLQLLQEIVNKKIIFDNSISIQGSRGKWSLSDGINAFMIQKEDGRLNVYELPESANKVILYIPQDAHPAIVSLRSELKGETYYWKPQRDLLNSRPTSTDFVVEVESNGTAFLRFGNYMPQSDNASSANCFNNSTANRISQAHGLRPGPGTKFRATYRIGNGKSGNVGAEAIAHIICDNRYINGDDQSIIKVRNPLSTRGGVEPESIENVRQSAPSAFRIQERAVTEKDYAEVAERHPEVKRAAATFRWTGSWRTVFITIDRLAGLPVDDNFKQEMRKHINRYRMAGYDIDIDNPRCVSLEIEMFVCVKPDYFRSDIEAILLQIFSNRILPNGQPGIFYPDNFTFGQTVYLSPLYAAAQAVDGVSFVQVRKFQRQGIDSNEARDAGKLILGRLEIARLDNDPNFPEHGIFRLILEGGK